MKLTFAPNLDSRDLLRLFEEPDTWAAVRPFIDEIELPAASCRPEAFRPPNTLGALIGADAFEWLREWGVKLAVGGGALKGWDPWGEIHREQMHEAVTSVRTAGGQVSSFAVDEAIYAGKLIGHSPDVIAQVLGNFVREAADIGVACTLIEPFPALDFSYLQAVLTKLPQRPPRFELDVDQKAWGSPSWWERLFSIPHGLHRTDIQREIRVLFDWIHQYGMETSIVLTGGQAATQIDYQRQFNEFADLMRGALKRSLDRIDVKSWWTQPGVAETPEAERWMPNNLPVESPRSHLGLVANQVNLWDVQAVEREEIPAPPEPPAPELPRIRVRGTGFVIEGTETPWIWRGCSDFALYKRYLDGVEIRPILEQRAEIGANLLRVFGMLHYLERFYPQDYGDRYYEQIPAFLQLLAGYGLYCEFVVFADQQEVRVNLQGHYWGCVGRLAQHPCFLELCNEYPKNGVVPRDFNRPNEANILASAGSALADAPPAVFWDFFGWHGRRDFPKVTSSTEDMWYVIRDQGIPGVHDEPARQERPEEFDKYLAQQLGATARVLGAGATFHSPEGLRSELFSPRTCTEATYFFDGLGEED